MPSLAPERLRAHFSRLPFPLLADLHRGNHFNARQTPQTSLYFELTSDVITANMVLYQGIKAAVLRYRDAQPYTEYAPTESTADGLYKRKRIYIEAGTGERFMVMVEVTPEFNFKSSSHVQITTYLHDGAESNWPIAAKDVSSSTSAEAKDARQVVWDTDERVIDGKWMSCGLAFSELRKGTNVRNRLLATPLTMIGYRRQAGQRKSLK
jgi:hypothetical protein